jgi:hypothetical protein
MRKGLLLKVLAQASQLRIIKLNWVEKTTGELLS